MPNKQFSSRYFNNVWYDEVNGKVIKLSSDIGKLSAEYLYYRSLPLELHKFFVEPISFKLEGTYAILETQYMNASPLSELYGDIHQWKKIFTQLQFIHEVFSEYHIPNPNQIQHLFYIDKIITRLESYYSSTYWGRSVEQLKHITVNNITIPNWKTISEDVFTYIRSVEVPELNIIHGDWCFSNILKMNYTDRLVLVDPRGAFGSEICYGDSVYDIAKLYHSIHGMYDDIVADKIETNYDIINGAMRVSYYTEHMKPSPLLMELFDEFFPVDKKYLLILEGMLFLSMCPLHKESDTRSILMYARGLEILNSGLQM
jgi:hypothetical protein